MTKTCGKHLLNCVIEKGEVPTREVILEKYHVTDVSKFQGDQIGTFGAKFEKFGTLRLELATKSSALRCQLFWHPFGTLEKFVKKFPKCLEIA